MDIKNVHVQSHVSASNNLSLVFVVRFGVLFQNKEENALCISQCTNIIESVLFIPIIYDPIFPDNV